MIMSENNNKKKLLSIGNKVKQAREKMGLTQEQFADKFGYARTTLAKLEAGLRDFKSTEIIKLAEQLDVSCDYLLGRTRVAAPNDIKQKINELYGLDENSLDVLSNMPTTDEVTGIKVVSTSGVRADTISIRAVINLLLSSEDGIKALEHLALYFFGELGIESLISFNWAIETGQNQTFIKGDLIDDEAIRETLLRISDKYFQDIRFSRYEKILKMKTQLIE
ncbi:MAG: helix-turn-helix domain-containing protein [Eubacterium sp.]|jgi:transcriptional regulator with XRE-family HTH domain|nr:helix-turn-helix domain-containing protein [Eubacterium sp.]